MAIPSGTTAAQSATRELRARIVRFIARRVRDPALADDLAQEVFLRMSAHADDLRDASAISSWAYRIATNVIVDHARRKRPLASLDDGPEPASPDEENANINADVAEWIRPMLALLPPEYAEALALTELEGLTQRELAERLGISMSGARSRVQRGRRMLKDVLLECCRVDVDARGNVLDAVVRDRPKRPRDES